jgi:DNA mismatch endonuclease (patch repair protein)
MSAIRGKDTTPGRIVRSALHRLGCRFALHRADLAGKPDIVMPARGAVVLVHGCYWHMHTCKRGRSTPATHAAFWRIKRKRNRERDRKTPAALRRAGWRVVVVWECELKSSKIGRVIERLQAIRQGDEPLQRPRGYSSEGRHARTPNRRSQGRRAEFRGRLSE